jgi:hypothetical protein
MWTCLTAMSSPVSALMAWNTCAVHAECARGMLESAHSGDDCSSRGFFFSFSFVFFGFLQRVKPIQAIVDTTCNKSQLVIMCSTA